MGRERRMPPWMSPVITPGADGLNNFFYFYPKI